MEAPALLEQPTDFIVDDNPTVQPPESGVPEDEATLSEKADVKKWLGRIKRAERKWEPDFKRMQENMRFASGKQWQGQATIQSDRYVANLTLRMVSQKVATLYAKNPTFMANRRKRLNYQLWDGKIESIQQAVGTALSSMQSMGMVPSEASALMNDFQRGKSEQELVDRVAETLELLFQYQIDSQEPDFKTQAKQWVRRVSVTGVGYIKVLFCRDYEDVLTHSETQDSIVERAKMAESILERLTKGEITEDDPEVETLKNLVASLNIIPMDSEATRVKEHLIFDFPPATSIIPDEECRALKGFVGAHWIAEKFIYSLDKVNAKYGLDIKPGGDLVEYRNGTKTATTSLANGGLDEAESPMVCLYQVYNLDSKDTFIVCEGYKSYVQKPEPVSPSTSGFWTIFPLTFNDVEAEEGSETSIFPPSDVELIRHPQKEWNRTRDSLRKQRKANAPKYMAPKGALSENDKANIVNAEGNDIIELEQLAPGADPSKVVVPLQTAPIDPSVYDTKPLAEDAMLATGQQEANMGPAPANVTATVGTIAEQSRMTVAASNVDDLDDCLTAVAQCGGQMLLAEMSAETVLRVVGRGAVWPEQSRDDFLNQINLKVLAASSGRPNKAIEVSNFQQLAPLLLQAGANPQAIIREAVKRLDDQLDPTDFFPIMPPMPPQGAAQPSQGSSGGQPTTAESPAKPNGVIPPSPASQEGMAMVG